MNFKTYTAVWALLSLIFSPITAASAQMTTGGLPLDGYAATVNKRIITIGEVKIAIHEAEERLRMMRGNTDVEAKRQELFTAGLERLIDQALILEEFTSMQGVIPDRAIDDRVNEIIQERFNNDRAALLAALAEDQITLEEWRETIRDRLIVSIMRRREVGDRIVISPRQLMDEYEARQDRYQQPAQSRFRLIFLPQGPDTDVARQLMIEARDRILTGTPFEEEARTTSKDPSAALGGDWGWIEPGMLRDELRNALEATSVGEISDIVATPEGYYLIKVEERRDAYVKTFEEVRREIETELRERESERLYRDWVERLRNKYSIIYYLPVLPRQT
ncbi:MAG TPA: peptidyl-prolyl cis-trans isomerase [Kiritimatiellia bacterium]|nr:peptidyl-prolyl cis-trans isomerase [Kiritimatiellia bacterium]